MSYIVGWEGLLEDGTKVKTVWVKDVPEAYWRKYSSACFAGSFTEGNWLRQGPIPRKRAQAVGGGVTKAHRNLNYTCIIPADFFGPIENEFGVESP